MISMEGRSAQVSADRSAARLRAVILLAGAVRRSKWADAIGRSPLALPVSSTSTVLDEWLRQIAELGDLSVGNGPPSVRIVINGHAGALEIGEPLPANVEIEQDPADFRGTGGLLRDVTQRYDRDDWVLVLNAFQLPVQPLRQTVLRLLRSAGDLRLASSASGTPALFALARCACFGELEGRGFVDLKEQGLPKIARRYSVTALRRAGSFGAPVTSFGKYVRALTTFHRIGRDGQAPAGEVTVLGDPLAERWRSTFAVVEDGASVDEEASLHDSVVLAGARVERGAVVARSVVCPGAVVRRGEQVVDRVAGGSASDLQMESVTR